MTSSAVQQALTRDRPRIPVPVILSFLAFITIGSSAGLIGVAFPSIRAEFGLPLDAIGVILLAATTGHLTTSSVSGAIQSRFGVGGMVALGGLLLSIGLIGFTLVTVWALPAAFAVFIGFGTGMIDSSMNSYSAEHFTQRTLNWLHASFGVGITLSPVIMTIVFNNGGSWRVGYLLVGGLALLLMISATLLRKIWIADDSGDAGVLPRASLLATLRQPLAWAGIFIFVTYAGAESLGGQWGYSIMTQLWLLPAALAGTLFSLYRGGFTLGRIIFGAIIGTIQPMPLIRTCLLVAMIGTVLWWWSPMPSIGTIGLLISGFFLAPMFPFFVSSTPDRVGRAHTPNLVGFQIAASGIGLSLIPTIGGVLAEGVLIPTRALLTLTANFAPAYLESIPIVGLNVVPPLSLMLLVSVFVINEIAHAAAGRPQRAIG